MIPSEQGYGGLLLRQFGSGRYFSVYFNLQAILLIQQVTESGRNTLWRAALLNKAFVDLGIAGQYPQRLWLEGLGFLQ